MAATFGCLLGATAFSTINWRLAQHGARHRIAVATASSNRRRRSTKGAVGEPDFLDVVTGRRSESRSLGRPVPSAPSSRCGPLWASQRILKISLSDP
jgi:hypothetical protein